MIVSHNPEHIKQLFEEELNKMIKEYDAGTTPFLGEGRSMEHVFEECLKLSSIVSTKANKQSLFYYGNAVKLAGLVLKYLLKKNLASEEVINIFVTWCDNKRVDVTGWSLEDLATIDNCETNEIPVDIDDLSLDQRMTFLGLQHTYDFFTEMMIDEASSFQEVKKYWLELLKNYK